MIHLCRHCGAPVPKMKNGMARRACDECWRIRPWTVTNAAKLTPEASSRFRIEPQNAQTRWGVAMLNTCTARLPTATRVRGTVRPN
jgi:hypothetical protein